MTGQLEKAIRRVEALPEKEQDAIAAQILANLDDEEAWDSHYRLNVEQFQAMASEALEDRRGETRPLEEVPGE